MSWRLVQPTSIPNISRNRQGAEAFHAATLPVRPPSTRRDIGEALAAGVPTKAWHLKGADGAEVLHPDPGGHWMDFGIQNGRHSGLPELTPLLGIRRIWGGCRGASTRKYLRRFSLQKYHSAADRAEATRILASSWQFARTTVTLSFLGDWFRYCGRASDA